MELEFYKAGSRLPDLRQVYLLDAGTKPGFLNPRKSMPRDIEPIIILSSSLPSYSKSIRQELCRNLWRTKDRKWERGFSTMDVRALLLLSASLFLMHGKSHSGWCIPVDWRLFIVRLHSIQFPSIMFSAGVLYSLHIIWNRQSCFCWGEKVNGQWKKLLRVTKSISRSTVFFTGHYIFLLECGIRRKCCSAPSTKDASWQKKLCQLSL